MHASVTFKPTAQCRGITEVDPDKYGHDTREVIVPCSLGWQPHAYSLPDETAVKWARKHAQQYPGHEVIVEQRIRSIYYTDAPAETDPA
jgi:hypothetical protein